MKTIPCVSIVILWSVWSACVGASFDCTNARTSMERMVCADPDLSNMDSELSSSYKAARVSSPQVVRDQKVWLSAATKCSDVDCLKSAYETRLEQLRSPSEHLTLPPVQNLAKPDPEHSKAKEHPSQQAVADGPANGVSRNGEMSNRNEVILVVVGLFLFLVLGIAFNKCMRRVHRLLGGGEFADALIGKRWGPDEKEFLREQNLLRAIRERK